MWVKRVCHAVCRTGSGVPIDVLQAAADHGEVTEWSKVHAC